MKATWVITSWWVSCCVLNILKSSSIMVPLLNVYLHNHVGKNVLFFFFKKQYHFKIYFWLNIQKISDEKKSFLTVFTKMVKNIYKEEKTTKKKATQIYTSEIAWMKKLKIRIKLFIYYWIVLWQNRSKLSTSFFFFWNTFEINKFNLSNLLLLNFSSIRLVFMYFFLIGKLLSLWLVS